MGINKLYNHNNIEYAKMLRKAATPAERLLWKFLKGRQLSGYKFKRQQPLLNYIVDFYNMDMKLAIEIDGISHDEKKYSYDIYRQSRLEAIGITFLRFTEYEVKNNIDSILKTVELWINNNT